MNRSNNFPQIIIFIGAVFCCAACGGLASPDVNVNLPQNQNTNQAVVSPMPLLNVTPVPAATMGETSNASPETANVLTNTNSVITAPSNASVNSINDNSPPPAADKLIIPVAGVKPAELRDTFNDARSEGRVHDAIDIMAAQGTPVLAAADGEIARFFDSERGGITIYQFSRDKKLMYYYAHLQSRADEIQEHQFVRQGTVIGYVGDTGNAGAGNFHLHFAIWIITDPKRYWDGTNINPYDLLR